MSKAVSFDYSKALPFVGQHEIDYLEGAVRVAHEQLHNGTGTGSDYIGWLICLPSMTKKSSRASSKPRPKFNPTPKC